VSSITIVSDAQIVASLTGNSVGIIYEHDMFIEQAAGVCAVTLFYSHPSQLLAGKSGAHYKVGSKPFL
jgi:hypothetical protein